MATGPRVVDVTHILDKEEGSAFDDQSLMFSSFDSGDVFDYDSLNEIRDMKDMLEVDGKAATLEQVLSLPIRAAPYSIQRNRARSEVHERITAIMQAPANAGGMTTPINTVIAQMCNAQVYRRAFFEKVWTATQGGVGYKKVAWRPPGTCTIQRDPKHGSFRGFRQMPIRIEDTDEIIVPPQRAFVYIHGSNRDPLNGISDLKITHWCYQTKQKIRFLWYQFLEGQALPKTIVKASDETSAMNAAKKIIGLRGGGVVGIEKDIDVDPLESSGRGAAEFKSAMQWLDGEASSSVLAGFTDLGSTAAAGTGSFALSKDQTDFFLMSRQAVAKEMQDFINQFLIADLVFWNFGPHEIAPEFEFGPIAQDDAQSAIGLLQAMAPAHNPGSPVPQEFYDELIERVAGLLELDVITVRDGLERAKEEAKKTAATQGATEAEQEVAGVKAVVDEATDKVREAVIPTKVA